MDELFEFKRNALSGALTDPLCKEYRREWTGSERDKEKLVTLAMRQQSCPYFAHYCYKGMGLSREYIIRNFGKYINGYTIMDADGVAGYTYGLYVGYDYDNSIIMDKDVAHIMWTIDSSVIVPLTKCPVIYISNRSNITLNGEGYNTIKIYLFDESIITIDDIDNDTSVTIYKYSDKCQVNTGRFCFGKIKEFNKELKL